MPQRRYLITINPHPRVLVYEQGGFFLPHRDREKQDGMVASLIVVLANPFEGGALVVRHGAAKRTLRFEGAATGRAPGYAAFYADCEHEVERVTQGVRLCLAYNLVLKPSRSKPADGKLPPDDTLTESPQAKPSGGVRQPYDLTHSAGMLRKQSGRSSASDLRPIDFQGHRAVRQSSILLFLLLLQ